MATTARAVWHQDRFLIGGFQIGGRPDPGRLVLLNEAGVDFVINSDYPYPPYARQVVRTLDSLRANRPGFNLRAMLYSENCNDPIATFKNADPVRNRERLLQALRPGEGLNSASVMGWMVWDEPPLYYGGACKPDVGADQTFRNVANITKVLRDSAASRCCFDQLAFTNLLPMHAVPHVYPACGKGGRNTYACYLDRFLSAFDDQPLPAPVLCADIYPFEVPQRFILERYFEQLALLRDKAAQYSRPHYRIPFWSVIQTGRRRESAKATYHDSPTFNEIRWQAFVSIAHGARALIYWTTAPWQPAEAAVGYGPSFLTPSGGRNGALYDSLKALNAQLRAIGPILMSLEPVRTEHASSRGFYLPPDEDSLSNPGRTDRFVASATGGNNEALVSRFRNPATGAPYLLVVNKDTRQSRRFSLTLGAKVAALHRVDRISGVEKRATLGGGGTAFTTSTLRPGEGELYRLQMP